MKKTAVLFTLFVLPIVAYLFFASGVNNFGKLPVLTENVADISSYGEVSLKDKITIMGFMGTNVVDRQGNAFNLNQKIYKRFHEFKDFQFVMVVPKGQEKAVQNLKSELGHLGDTSKWNFVFLPKGDIGTYFSSLKTGYQLDNDLGTSYVFIIDKDLKLRGREDDEDEGIKFGYDTNRVSELNNKMEDDVKIILAEYRLALKKNNADR